MIDYDDDNLYETYEPQVGEMYAEGGYRSRNGVEWYETTVMPVYNPHNNTYIYRRLKPTKKEAPMSIPPRTERDALKAADESGATKAWYSGKPVQYRFLDAIPTCWVLYAGSSYPNFCCDLLEWSPAPAVPPKAVKLDCRPVSEPPEIGTEVLGYSTGDATWLYLEWYNGAEGCYTHWAPQPLAPEAE
jgi:hypothetical protein